MHRCAAAALVLATPVATWFVVGDLSPARFEDLDYMWRAPALPAPVELVLGVLAALIAVVSATVVPL